MKISTQLLAGVTLAAACQLAAANDEPDPARVISGPANLAQYLYEVELTAVDGNYIGRRQLLTLEPGDYTLTARIPARFTEAAVGQRKKRWDEEVDFDISLKPGADYGVQVKWNRTNLAKPYELVVTELR
jgi:hypothetical protein